MFDTALDTALEAPQQPSAEIRAIVADLRADFPSVPPATLRRLAEASSRPPVSSHGDRNHGEQGDGAPYDGAAIPPGLDHLEPGPVLAALLAHIDVNGLSGHDRIVVLRSQQRMASHYSARVYEAMTAVADHMQRDDEDYRDDYLGAMGAAAAEIRVALRLTRRATDTELSLALELRDRLPRVYSALLAGEIDIRRAKTIAHHTTHLPEDTARWIVHEVIDAASTLSTGQLAARLKKLAVAAGPDRAEQRYEAAVAQRRLAMSPTVDGTATLAGYDLAPDQAVAAVRHINRLARRLRRHGEARTMDQLRADVFLDLLTGAAFESTGEAAGAGNRGVVDVQVDLTTLARLDDHPGDLAGYGPVIADIARRVAEEAGNAQWRYTVTDPDSGQIVHSGVTRRRRHTASQRRAIAARDRTCVFPGCRMPASDCDMDHITLYSEGGVTTVVDGAPLCRHDHVGRHRHRWRYQRLPNGDYLWTTRLGHRYTTSGHPP